MNSDKTGSAGSSAETSPSKPPQALTESEYLVRQAELASQAMGQTFRDMTRHLKEGVDVKAWMQQYPWISLGAGAAAGFLVASAITPSRDETLKERLKSLFPEVPAVPVQPGQSVQYGPAAKPQKPGMVSGLTQSLMDAIKTALVSTISSAVTAQVHKDSGNGQDAGHEPARDPTAPTQG